MNDLARTAACFMVDRAISTHAEFGYAIPAMMFVGDHLDAIVASSMSGSPSKDLTALARALSFPTAAHTLCWVAECWFGSSDNDVPPPSPGELQERVEDGDASVETAIVGVGLTLATGRSVVEARRKYVADDGAVSWHRIDAVNANMLIEAIHAEASRVPVTDLGEPVVCSPVQWRSIAEDVLHSLWLADTGSFRVWTAGTLERAFAAGG